MMHPKLAAWEKKLKVVFDQLDDYLEEKYGDLYPLHPVRMKRGETSNKSQDGLFNIGASFTAGYGSRLGRGYTVDIHMSTLSRVPEAVRFKIQQDVLSELRKRLVEVFHNSKLQADMDGNLIKIHGDLGLGTL